MASFLHFSFYFFFIYLISISSSSSSALLFLSSFFFHVYLLCLSFLVDSVRLKQNPRRYCYPNGDIYEGECNVSFQRHGKGRLRIALTGRLYEGEWEEDRLGGYDPTSLPSLKSLEKEDEDVNK
jgi:hypothetical protein